MFYVDGAVLLVLYLLGAISFLIAGYLVIEVQELQMKIKQLEARPRVTEQKYVPPKNPWNKK